MVKLFTDDQVLGWLMTNMQTRYWYGTHGHKCTEDLLRRKRSSIRAITPTDVWPHIASTSPPVTAYIKKEADIYGKTFYG